MFGAAIDGCAKHRLVSIKFCCHAGVLRALPREQEGELSLPAQAGAGRCGRLESFGKRAAQLRNGAGDGGKPLREMVSAAGERKTEIGQLRIGRRLEPNTLALDQHAQCGWRLRR